MQISAETRWFWKDAAPVGLEDWFTTASHHGCPAGGGRERTDKYVEDGGQSELGIKLRGDKPGYEVKGLVTVVWGGLTGGPLAGRLEVWTKWTSRSLVIDEKALISIRKVRWLRKFDTKGVDPVEVPLNDNEDPIDPNIRGDCLPVLGCHAELTRVTNAGGQIWWTLGLEAFGKLSTVENDLCAVASLLVARGLPTIAVGQRLSYPVWLRKHAR